jgi:uncharacterized protein YicC (UPF0701 family)
MVQEEIGNSNERMMLLMEQQHNTRKESDLRLVNYIDDESNFIREAIDQEASKREEEGRCIKESLEADLSEITRAIDETSNENMAKLTQTESSLMGRVDTLVSNLK